MCITNVPIKHIDTYKILYITLTKINPLSRPVGPTVSFSGCRSENVKAKRIPVVYHTEQL